MRWLGRIVLVILVLLFLAVAAWQVAAALRILCGESAQPRILTLDVWSGAIRQVDLPDRDPQCPTCGRHEFDYLEGRRRAPIGTSAAR